MLIVTTNDVPGQRVVKTLGVVRGITVRSRNAISDMVGGLQSMLGGRVILKDLASRGADHTGLGFLDPYGAEVGETWRAFVIVLESQVSDPGEAAVGALAAFGCAEDILCMEDAA